MPRQRTVDTTLEPFRNELGKVPDQQIADRAGVSRAAVVNVRKRLGIEAYEGYKFVSGGGRATAPEVPVKRGRGRPRKVVVEGSVPAPKPERRKPGRKSRAEKEAAAAALALVPAVDAAAVANVTASDAAGFRGRKSALDPYLHLLGKMSDKEISALANVSTENVRAYRMRRSIASARTSRKDEASGVEAPVAAVVTPSVVAAPVPVVAQVAAPAALVSPRMPESAKSTATGLTAYAVGWSTDGGANGTYVVLAGDMRGAASAAETALALRHPGALLQSLSRVAEVLG